MSSAWYLNHTVEDTLEYVNKFEFRVGETWLSSIHVPFVTIALYLVTIKLLKQHVAARKEPYDLRSIISAYNLGLSIGSGILLLLLGSEIATLIKSSSVFSVACDAEEAFLTGPHHFYYYINFLFKFVELIDTVFLCLRNKPTPFLHVYHHSATLLLCWTQLAARNCIQWGPIILNLCVHVIMYYYYHRVSAGHKVSWKKHVTTLQIIQFVVGVSTCAIPYISRNMHFLEHNMGLPLGGFAIKCTGAFVPATFGVIILLSYLVLFIRFYGNTYDNKVVKKE